MTPRAHCVLVVWRLVSRSQKTEQDSANQPLDSEVFLHVRDVHFQSFSIPQNSHNQHFSSGCFALPLDKDMLQTSRIWGNVS